MQAFFTTQSQLLSSVPRPCIIHRALEAVAFLPRQPMKGKSDIRRSMKNAGSFPPIPGTSI